MTTSTEAMRTVIVPIPRAPRRELRLRVRRVLSLPFRHWRYTLALALVAFVGLSFALATCLWPFEDQCFRPSRIKQSEIHVQALGGATMMYLAEHPGARCPNVPELVAGGYLDQDKRLTDEWDNPMLITCEGTEVTVTSAGPDQQFGTEDDIE